MSSMNPFELLGDVDNDDPSQLLAAAELKAPKKAPAPAQAQPAKPAAKLPSKPLPPAQAVRESRNEGGRGEGGRGEGGRGGRGGGRGFGRGGRGGFNRDSNSSEIAPGANDGYAERRSYSDRPSEEGDGRRAYVDRPRGGGGGFRGRRGGITNGEAGEGERPRRTYERHSGTGRGKEIKREGSGPRNWGTATDDIAPETEEPTAEVEKNAGAEKLSGEEVAGDANKENPPANEAEEKEPEPEDKEMTLEEYEKLLEEKRKALLALKAEERKVELDKELKSMQPLSSKKTNDEIFIKLGSEKDKRKEAAEKEDKAKKSVSINEFLKPADGERYQGGRGRGRGRGPRGGFGGGYGSARDAAAPKIEDQGQFPSLGGK